MNIVINFESETPIYIQIRNEIVRGIASGDLESGYSLPSVRAFADDIGVNMHTVNKAYNILKSEGYIVLDRRHGAFISVSKKNEEDIERFKAEFETTILSCLAKGLDKEEIDLIINEIYSGIKGGKE